MESENKYKDASPAPWVQNTLRDRVKTVELMGKYGPFIDELAVALEGLAAYSPKEVFKEVADMTQNAFSDKDWNRLFTIAQTKNDDPATFAKLEEEAEAKLPPTMKSMRKKHHEDQGIARAADALILDIHNKEQAGAEKREVSFRKGHGFKFKGKYEHKGSEPISSYGREVVSSRAAAIALMDRYEDLVNKMVIGLVENEGVKPIDVFGKITLNTDYHISDDDAKLIIKIASLKNLEPEIFDKLKKEVSMKRMFDEMAIEKHRKSQSGRI